MRAAGRKRRMPYAGCTPSTGAAPTAAAAATPRSSRSRAAEFARARLDALGRAVSQLLPGVGAPAPPSADALRAVLAATRRRRVRRLPAGSARRRRSAADLSRCAVVWSTTAWSSPPTRRSCATRCRRPRRSAAGRAQHEAVGGDARSPSACEARQNVFHAGSSRSTDNRAHRLRSQQRQRRQTTPTEIRAAAVQIGNGSRGAIGRRRSRPGIRARGRLPLTQRHVGAIQADAEGRILGRSRLLRDSPRCSRSALYDGDGHERYIDLAYSARREAC